MRSPRKKPTAAKLRNWLYFVALFGCLIQPASADPWNSPEECYNAHIRSADGWYPLPSRGDDPTQLMKHCMYEFKAKRCSFMCEVPRIGWLFAVQAPAHQREARIRAYFKGAELQRTACDIITRLFKGCPQEE
jgi:hypothetical protein